MLATASLLSREASGEVIVALRDTEGELAALMDGPQISTARMTSRCSQSSFEEDDTQANLQSVMIDQVRAAHLATKKT